MTRSSLNIHYPLNIPTCLPTAFVLLVLFGSISISLKEGAYEFKFPILMLGGWVLRLTAFVNNFVSIYSGAEVFWDYSTRIWKSRMGKSTLKVLCFGKGRECFSPQPYTAHCKAWLNTVSWISLFHTVWPAQLRLFRKDLRLPWWKTTSRFWSNSCCRIWPGGQAGSTAEHLSGDLKHPLYRHGENPLLTSVVNHSTKPQREVSKEENLKGP